MHVRASARHNFGARYRKDDNTLAGHQMPAYAAGEEFQLQMEVRIMRTMPAHSKGRACSKILNSLLMLLKSTAS
jgi:hypothetical protein